MRRPFIASLFALVCALSLHAADQPNVAALAEAYDHPTLAPAAKVQGLSVGIGNMTFELTSGSAAAVTVEKEIVGLYFVGTGHYNYQTAEPVEAALVALRSKKILGRTAEKQGNALTIRADFTELYLLTGGVQLPELKGDDGGSLDERFKQHRERFAHARLSPASHLLIRQRLDRPVSPVAVAEIDAGEAAVYIYDTIESKSESLTGFTHVRGMAIRELSDEWFPATVSDQPIGRNLRSFVQPAYLLTDLDYTLTAGDKDMATLSVTETIQPLTIPQIAYRFDLLSSVWDTNGRARDFHLRSVKDEAGHDLPYHFARSSLIVGLLQKASAPFKIHFEIAGDFLFHPSGDSFWELGVRPWFPQPDLNGQYYTIHSIVKVKPPYTAFAPGDTVARTQEGEYNVVENRLDKPVQFAVVLAGKYGVAEDKHEDVTVRVASYAGKDQLAMKQLSNLAYKMIKFYEPWLGPFPFKEFNIIEIHELGFGQAPPATMFITKEAFNPLSGEDNQFFSKGINERFAHEIAHQYWGHVVKMGSSEEQWITEAFAEYSASLVIKQLKGQGAYDSLISTWRANATMRR
ncbi:MAG TPA: M1 family aminopeptidase, partial [Thermoanaerobaculia bacterium]|nr:M1 family aminopeptidase [Thermoanaerobaculia bacterium]